MAGTRFDDIAGSPKPEEFEEAAAAATEEVPQPASSAYTDEIEFEADDLLMPRLRLGQGLTPEVVENKAKAGEWLLSGHDAVKEVVFVPLRVAKTRARLSTNSDNRLVVLCSSQDAKVGVGDPGGNCRTCPFSEWQPKAGSERNAPPECQLNYSYIGFSVTHQSVVEIGFKRTSLNAAKLINTMIQTRKIGNFAVTLGAQGQRNSRGTFFTPTVNFAVVDPSVFSTAKQLMAPRVTEDVPF